MAETRPDPLPLSNRLQELNLWMDRTYASSDADNTIPSSLAEELWRRLSEEGVLGEILGHEPTATRVKPFLGTFIQVRDGLRDHENGRALLAVVVPDLAVEPLTHIPDPVEALFEAIGRLYAAADGGRRTRTSFNEAMSDVANHLIFVTGDETLLNDNEVFSAARALFDAFPYIAALMMRHPNGLSVLRVLRPDMAEDLGPSFARERVSRLVVAALAILVAPENERPGIAQNIVDDLNDDDLFDLVASDAGALTHLDQALNGVPEIIAALNTHPRGEFLRRRVHQTARSLQPQMSRACSEAVIAVLGLDDQFSSAAGRRGRLQRAGKALTASGVLDELRTHEEAYNDIQLIVSAKTELQREIARLPEGGRVLQEFLGPDHGRNPGATL